MSQSKEKTVLFFPLNSPGHINSSLGIADRIKSQPGYKTVFLVLGQTIGNSIQDHGHDLVLLDEANPYEDYELAADEEPEFPVDEDRMRREGRVKRKFFGAHKWPQVLYRYQKYFLLDPVETFVKTAHTMEELMVGELTQNHANYVKAIEAINPDIVIIDAYYVPPCIVTLKHIPWVRLYSANPMMLAKSRLPGGVKPPPMVGFKLYDKQTRLKIQREQPQVWSDMLNQWQVATDKIVKAIEMAGGKLQPFLIENGCSPLEPGQQAHDSPHLNIYMYPEALDYDQDDDLFEYPARWIRCDSLLRKSSSAICTAEIELWKAKIDEASRGKRHIVYFSLGSIASGNVSLMKRFIELLRTDKSRLYIVSKGVSGHRYELDESNMIGADYLPQSYCLERSNLALIHGGNNSITECMYHGLPMVVLPCFADQLDNGQRVEDLHLGRRLDVFRCNRQDLIGTIDEVLSDQELVNRVRQIGLKMRSTDDIGKITMIIKKLIDDKRLDQTFIDVCKATKEYKN